MLHVEPIRKQDKSKRNKRRRTTLSHRAPQTHRKRTATVTRTSTPDPRHMKMNMARLRLPLLLLLLVKPTCSITCTRPSTVGYTVSDDTSENLDTDGPFNGGLWSCNYRNGYVGSVVTSQCSSDNTPYTLSGCALSTAGYTCGTAGGIFVLNTVLSCPTSQVQSLTAHLTILGDQPTGNAEIQGGDGLNKKYFLKTIEGNEYALTLRNLIISGWRKWNGNVGHYGSTLILLSEVLAILDHVTFDNNGGRGDLDPVGSECEIGGTTRRCTRKCESGGALYTGFSTKVEIVDSTFTNNVCLGEPSLAVLRNQDRDQTTDDGLGGAMNLRGTTTIKRTTFENCKARGGGAIYNSGQLAVEDSTFRSNTATGTFQFTASDGGGAIYNKGAMTCVRCTFDGEWLLLVVCLGRTGTGTTDEFCLFFLPLVFTRQHRG